MKEEREMPTTSAKDIPRLVGPTQRMAKGKKKPARKTGAMGTPRKQATRTRTAKKTRK